MSSDPNDLLKVAAVQAAHGGTPTGDSQLDLIMQSLMIDDADVKRILKGEIHEPINRLNQMIVAFQQQISWMEENPLITAKENTDLFTVLSNIKKILGIVEKQQTAIYNQLESYKEYVPYLMLLSPSTVLSNITRKEAEILWRKMDIMLMRSKLKAKRKSRTMETRNFYDAVGIKLYLQLQRSIEGHTFFGLTREKKEVTTIVQDQTNKNKRRLF